MKSESTFLFTSESVGEGHPDKICDQVADAILDECLKQNPLSKVAIEVAVRPRLVIVFGVVHFISQLDVDTIARLVLKDIGYVSPDQELDYRACEVMDCVELHPSLFNGIAAGLEAPDNEPAGDQVRSVNLFDKHCGLTIRSLYSRGWLLVTQRMRPRSYCKSTEPSIKATSLTKKPQALDH